MWWDHLCCLDFMLFFFSSSLKQVNFGRVPMLMRQPFSCQIRRNFLPGIRVELKQSPHQRSLRAQLYWLQVTRTHFVQYLLNITLPPFLAAVQLLCAPFMCSRWIISCQELYFLLCIILFHFQNPLFRTQVQTVASMRRLCLS